MKDYYTDEQVEEEIDRLQRSKAVKLAKKEQNLKNRRRQYMYSLRTLERRGIDLIAHGITAEKLEEMYKCEE